jgi:hypothetical protein
MSARPLGENGMMTVLLLETGGRIIIGDQYFWSWLGLSGKWKPNLTSIYFPGFEDNDVPGS